jgi:hypothetical protein
LLVSCLPEPDVTSSASSCAANFYTPFNPKNLNQCVDVCIWCNRGTTTTCSTSCALKGAR